VSASLAGAIKAHLEARKMGLPWFRDGAPKNQPLPFGTIQEGIALAPERHGDHADPGGHQGDTELVQLDIYQPARKADGAAPGRTVNAEDYDLPGLVRRVITLLGGTAFGTPPRRIYGATVVSGQRWPISDNTVRHTLTINVRRDA
jgi:hypothetical protein